MSHLSDPALTQTAYAPPPVVAAPTVEATPADLQQLKWGPIWAGLLMALGVFFLLSLAAIATGLQAAPGAAEEDLGMVAVVVTSAIAIVSFFLGGFVSAWSAGLSDAGRAILNGFLVWTLWLAIVILLAALGFGALVGAMGALFGDVAVTGPDVDPAELVDILRSSAWQTLLALGLTAVAATLGGAVGAREELRGRWRTFR
ncbi:MAG: hypothetical protein KF809_00190 [Chloroflexi bacterium]|nr:hypothetical protein [Chloroflexota bacterium]